MFAIVRNCKGIMSEVGSLYCLVKSSLFVLLCDADNCVLQRETNDTKTKVKSITTTVKRIDNPMAKQELVSCTRMTHPDYHFQCLVEGENGVKIKIKKIIA